MKSLLTVILLAHAWQAHSQQDILLQDGITNPALSMRCRELHRERSEKIKVQQRLNALLQRSQALMKKSPQAKETLHARLHASQVRIRNERNLVNMQIEAMEENIVRSGCPGIVIE
jgi:hypothetical protein